MTTALTPLERTRGPATISTTLWAVLTTLGDSRNRGRLITMAVGVGLSLLVLLTVAGVPNALASVTARDDARAPSWQLTSASSGFQASPATINRNGLSIDGLWLDGPATSEPPPGTVRFPAPGELLVSPALADLLRSNSTISAALPGTIVGEIDPATLLSPFDLSFFGGADLPDLAGIPASGWGQTSGIDMFSDQRYLMVLSVGTAVVVIPLLLIVALAARLGSNRRDRRSAALRLLGARVSQLRALVVAEAVLACTAGIILGLLLFRGLQAITPFIRLPGLGLQESDLSPSPFVGAVILLGVPVLAVTAAVLGARQAAVGPLGVLSRQSRPPRRWWRLVLIGATVAAALWFTDLDRRSDSYFVPMTLVLVTAGFVVLGLLTVAASVGLVTNVLARRASRTTSGTMAAGRLELHGAGSHRGAAAGAATLAGALIVLSLFQSPADDSIPAGGQTVVHDRAEIDQLESSLTSALSPGSRLWMMLYVPVDAPAVHWRVQTCSSIRDWYPELPCRDGDIFRSESGRGPIPGSVELITFDDPATADETPSAKATMDLPESLPVLPLSNTPTEKWSLVVTPGALERVLPGIFDGSRVEVSYSADTNARERVSRAISWLGIRGSDLQQSSSDHNLTLSILPWLRGGILAAGALTLVLAGLAQILSAGEQLADRRRSYALARATGVPVGVLQRALVWSALWPALIGSAAAALVAAAVTPALQLLRTTGSIRFDLWTTATGVAVLLGFTLLVSLISAAQLARSTGPDALRTE